MYKNLFANQIWIICSGKGNILSNIDQTCTFFQVLDFDDITYQVNPFPFGFGPVTLKDYDNGFNQRWLITGDQVIPRGYEATTVANLRLDVQGGGTSNGVVVGVFYVTGNANQQWTSTGMHLSISDWSENSHSRKIHPQKQCFAFHEIMFYFSSKL